MNMDLEKECTLLGNLFHHIVTDLKSSSPAWDDFVSRGTKLHSLLKSVTVALFAFTESIQKIADLATNTKGSTKDVGSALTRICVRQKMVESKLKLFTNSLLDNLLCPVQERLEEWKKVANQLEKDHSKDYKRATQEIKKRNSENVRLQKKARKGSKPDLLQSQLSSGRNDVNERFAILEETEKSALRNLLVEERSRICFFANCLSPVMDMQVSILNEASHLQQLSTDMSKLCRNPKQLPTSTDQLVQDYIAAHSDQSPTVQNSHTNGFLDSSSGVTPPSTPTSDDSRKSSLCSLNSLTSSDSFSSGSLNRASSAHQRHYQNHHRRNHSGNAFSGGLGSPTSAKSVPASGLGGPRLSISSHDSGFISTGNGNALPQYDVTSRLPSSINQSEKIETMNDMVDGAFPVIRGRSHSQQTSGSMLHQNAQNRFSWKDWDKPGPYDLKSPLPSKTDSMKDILPSKSVPPPVLSPKPFSYSQRSSIDESLSPYKVPLHRANTAPIINSLPQAESFPPPPPDMAPSSIAPQDDPLPPPPPALLDENLLSPPSAERTLTEEMLTYGTPSSDFPVESLNRKNSLNSLQYSTSSGYCSQYSTPACSEDAIASQDAEFYNGDNYDSHRYVNDACTTLPRSHQPVTRSKTLPRGGLHKRSTANNELPAKEAITNEIESGTATIRRKPSSKFNSIRRTTSGPKAVAPPTVPFFPTSPGMFVPSSDVHYNNSNNLASSDYGQQKLGVNRDLTLQFRQSADFCGDFPTPTTPVVGDPNHPYLSFSTPLSHSTNPNRTKD